MFNLSHSKSTIAVLGTLAAIAGGAVSAPAAQAAPAAANWTSVSANTANGAVPGTSVSLSGTQVWNTPTSRVDDSWPYFAGPAFSPALPKTDVIQISGASGASYTLRFGATVKDPILHLASLGSVIAFPAGTPVTRLSSEGGFTVSGSSVSGTPGNPILASGNSDSSGSIRVTGSYTSITFSATPNYNGPADGILVQLVAEATPGVTAPPPPTTGTQVGSGECTDWALYKRPDLAGTVSGDAQLWTEQARRAGRPVDKKPYERAVMVQQGGVMGAFAVGHVAYVESVQRDAAGNPTSFVVSEQNWGGSRSPTTRTIPVTSLPPSGVDFIR